MVSHEQSDPHPPTSSPSSRHGAPAPLVVAAGLTFVQGLVIALLGVSEVVTLDADRLVMGTTTAVFFLGFGLLLLLCAWGLHRVRGWARGPVLLAQLIWLGLAWNFREGRTMPLAIALAVAAAVVLAGLLHPRSIDALEHASGRA